MSKKPTFITYTSPLSSEIIITKPKLEEQTIKAYFSKPDDRDIDDYDREEHFDEAICIETMLNVRWG